MAQGDPLSKSSNEARKPGRVLRALEDETSGKGAHSPPVPQRRGMGKARGVQFGTSHGDTAANADFPVSTGAMCEGQASCYGLLCVEHHFPNCCKFSQDCFTRRLSACQNNSYLLMLQRIPKTVVQNASEKGKRYYSENSAATTKSACFAFQINVPELACLPGPPRGGHDMTNGKAVTAPPLRLNGGAWRQTGGAPSTLRLWDSH